MRHLFFLSALLFTCGTLQAQYSRIAPQPPSYSVVNQYGATLGQVIDTMYAHADATDTGEGGEMDQIRWFSRIWQERVTANDSSGMNMFEKYYNALGRAIREKTTSPGSCSGAWQLAGPDELPIQASGYINAIWASPTDSNYILAGSSYGGGLITNKGLLSF